MLSVEFRSYDVARLLVCAGASLDLQDKDGKTTLIIAAMTGNREIVQLLIQSGAI
jgi:ankyrin repeat protein